METDEIKDLLTQVVENQQRQLDLQSKSLAIQRDHLRFFLEQQERVKGIQDRAEAIQQRSAKIINLTLKAVPAFLTIVLLLLLYVAWLLRRF